MFATEFASPRLPAALHSKPKLPKSHFMSSALHDSLSWPPSKCSSRTYTERVLAPLLFDVVSLTAWASKPTQRPAWQTSAHPSRRETTPTSRCPSTLAWTWPVLARSRQTCPLGCRCRRRWLACPVEAASTRHARPTQACSSARGGRRAPQRAPRPSCPPAGPGRSVESRSWAGATTETAMLSLAVSCLRARMRPMMPA